jgi:hypothetical protein
VRVAYAACLLALAGTLTGCSTEDARQADARRAVETHVSGLSGYAGGVRCTHDPRPWFVERPATVFFCVVRRAEGGCDRFRATIENAGWDVVRDERDAGCSLPA